MQQREINSPVSIADRKKLDIRAGDNIRVWQNIQEKDAKTGKLKTRLQAFEGLCIAVKHGKEAGGTFTVRRIASGVGVEKTFPLYSPMINSIEIIKRSSVRRAKLYFIREKAAKAVRRQLRNARMLNMKSDETIAAAEEAPEVPVTEEKAEEVIV